MKNETRKSKKIVTHKAILFLMLISSSLATFIVISIGTFFFRHYTEDLSSMDKQSLKEYKYYYALIVEETKTAFWQSVYESAKEEGEKNNIYVEYIGEELIKQYGIKDKLKMAIASNVDGIMVVPEGEDIEEELKEAQDLDIPVITLLSDSLEESRTSFIGVEREEISQLYCEEIKAIGTKLDKVMILVDGSQQATSKNMMYLGIQEVLENEGIHVEIKYINRNNAFNAEEIIRNIILSPKMIPDVMICLSMEDTLCAYQSVIDYNKVGEVCIMGYGQSPTLLEGVSKGIIQSLLFIDTNQMGKQGIEALQQYELNKKKGSFFSVGVAMINQDNVERYIS